MAKTFDKDTRTLPEWIKDKWDEQAHFLQEEWRDFYNNIAFYDGYQWQSWDAKLMAYTDSPIEDEATQRVYMTSNLIKPLADTRIAMILNERPCLEVVSNDKSATSINQSEKDTNILKAIWQDLNMQSLLAQSIWWSVICNKVYLRPYWNTEYGQRIENPKYNSISAEIAFAGGEEYTEPENYRLGCLNVDLFNPFGVQYDRSQPTWQQVMKYGWVLIKTIRTLDSLYLNFDKKKVDQIIPDPKAAVCTVEEQLLRLRDRGKYEALMNDRRRSDSKQRNVEVYEFYQAPNDEHEDGYHAITCQDQSLYDSEESGEKFKRIPLIQIKDQIGTKSLVSGSRQKQKQYNLIVSKIIEMTRFPTIYGFSLDTGLDLEGLTSKAFHITNYDKDGGPPVVVQPTGLNEWWIFLMNKIETDLEHFWGTHEVTARSAPPGKSSSGRQVFLLQEADKSRLSTTMNMLGESLSDLGEILLDLAKEHFREPRTMDFVTSTGQATPITFSKKDISEQYKVSVEMTSEFKRNKQAYQQFITQLFGVIMNFPAVAQVLNNPMTMRNIISYFDDKLANELITRTTGMAVQERENEMLEAGQEPKVRPFHPHGEHIQIMLQWFNTVEFMEKSEEEQQRIIGSMETAQDGTKIPHGHFVTHLHYMNVQEQKKMTDQAMMKHGVHGDNAGARVFREAGQPQGPLQAIDQTIEDKVQPQPGNFGGEVSI